MKHSFEPSLTKQLTRVLSKPVFQAKAREPAQTYSWAHFIITHGSALISLLVKQGQS